MKYADNNPQIKFFCIPRAGCGAGELDWYKEIRPLFRKYLDERFIVCNFTDDRPRYAGIGSRNTPENIQDIITKLATKLESLGLVLRSGGDVGAESAFELGVLRRGNKEIYHATTDMPVKFVICWTPDGTGQAISIADSKGIKVLNLARIEDLDWQFN